MSGEAVQRLFVALWPDPQLRADIRAAAAPLIAGVPGRHVPESNWHATLVFIGSWPVARRDALETALSRVPVQAVEFDLEFLSLWPKPRAIVLEAGRAPPPLIHLVMRISEAVEVFGWQRPMRAYRPHVTLVRNAASIEARRLDAPLRFRANSFSLVSSEPGENGVVYRPLRTWPDGAGDESAGT